ncbi:uncharacterized protein L3040_000786 [Drepanopeziza brunnea f. sp. 'multigermtubi']|uniref:Fungal cellulose binding domain-containing protein n=1 Tax=Marssonina brunnea f. sp. multigermtubi (strain MB_m1) TaxID=1072389 RepID=K1WU68_MARBU|nr:fungal cellulose binding domain-containing protein [Drepanopeziza brunnea f. sp. 'multigermtubi' MB_m1]EKD21175.1 fungal cellulose binding domain-containing protein [Drepanopeziza brunnea f. sp. 'multigermtubi' MB_m1]KAJ5054515.1 hypothetical protein L3040_000786 [Drepanopeziza brunnea f. sp. 'multigermtubi']
MRSVFFLSTLLWSAVSGYNWKNVKIGGGGGFVPGIVFNPTEKGLAYARTDIGGLYRLNPEDDSWTPLQDYVQNGQWNEWGVDALASDPVEPNRVYIAVGMYTIDWDPNNGSILRSEDYGKTWARSPLPFKLGGNMPGRGMGERLAVDPQNNKIIYYGARSGNGLWKSVDQGVTFEKVTSFTAVGTYKADASDTTGYSSDINGLATITFDPTSELINGASSRIYVGTADRDSSTWVSEDAGETWKAMAGQPTGVFPHKMKYSTAEKVLYITYNSESGPYSAGTGSVYRVAADGTFSDITPAWATTHNLTIGYGGLALDTMSPGTLMVSAMNLWYPDVQIFRSNDSGASWTTIWDFDNGKQTFNYTYDTDKAPWVSNQRQPDDTKVLGWMVEALEINPFDSNHWLYGTGLTIYGGHDLEKWPSVHVSSLADGVEETAVKGLMCPPGLDAPLISAVLDVAGFVHKDLDVSPNDVFEDPFWSSTTGIDFAGQATSNILRIGNSKLATSSDGGTTWKLNTAVPATASEGSIAFSADASVIVWTSSAGSLLVANDSSTEIATLPKGISVVSDKVDPKYFYAGDTKRIYVSSDGGKSFVVTAEIASSGNGKMAVHPAKAGDVWYSSSSGVYHSTDFGQTFTACPSVTGGEAIAIGKGPANSTNVYVFATIESEMALRLSNDEGATWTAISNAEYGFGAASANVLAASWDTEGQVFVGTNGRGIFYGMP